MIFHLKLSVKKDSHIGALQGIRELFILRLLWSGMGIV
jgi:hypothetical protein